MTTDKAKKLSEEALNRLMEVLDRGQSDALKAYLSVMSRFHRYSWKQPTPNRFTPALSPLEKFDSASSFFLRVIDVSSWRNGLSATCTSGLKAESCRSINQSRIGGGYCALKRS